MKRAYADGRGEKLHRKRKKGLEEESWWKGWHINERGVSVKGKVSTERL